MASEILVRLLKQLAGLDFSAALKNAKRVILSEEDEKQPKLSPKYQTLFWPLLLGKYFSNRGSPMCEVDCKVRFWVTISMLKKRVENVRGYCI